MGYIVILKHLAGIPNVALLVRPMVHKYIYRYINNNKSIVQALLNHMQFMYDSIDSGHFVISAFLDFEKVFDTVDHRILLSKLDFYGIRGVSQEWLKSFLSEKNQITVIVGITYSSSSISH